MVAPLFFLMLFGVIEGGRLLFTYNQVVNAAREGARYAAANGCEASSPVSDSATVQMHVRALVAGMDTSALTVTAQWPDTDLTARPQVYCPDNQIHSNGPGRHVVVTASYPYQPIVPMVFGAGTITLTATSMLEIHY
jgi:Flp pilus assembly protein TadG